MPNWNPDQYLKFADERTRPCRDLADRISVDNPQRVIDLGCGPGNSTAVLAQRWPKAEITGMDSSRDMIDAAWKQHPEIHWTVGSIEEWAGNSAETFDIVFSNAALQWVEHHEKIFPQILNRVAKGGAFAAQMPGNFDGPAHRSMREVAKSEEFNFKFTSGIREWFSHDLAFYYDVLAPHASRLDLWETEYLHIMPSAEGIVEWYKGTGLRPFLQALPDEEERHNFLTAYLDRLRIAYPARPDGRVLFPFTRLFLIAYR